MPLANYPSKQIYIVETSRTKAQDDDQDQDKEEDKDQELRRKMALSNGELFNLARSHRFERHITLAELVRNRAEDGENLDDVDIELFLADFLRHYGPE